MCSTHRADRFVRNSYVHLYGKGRKERAIPLWPSTARIYPSIIDAAERDPEIAAMQSELHKYLMQSFHTVMARAKNRGDMPSDRSAAQLIATIVGPLFYRRWFSKESIDERFVELLVEAAFQ